MSLRLRLPHLRDPAAGRRLSEMLVSVANDPDRIEISVADIRDAMGDRAFGALMFVLAAPNALPVNAPGVSVVLGIPLLFQVPGMPMAFFASGDVRLYLGVPESPEFRSKVVLYFTVTDIDAEYERLRDQHGLSFTGEPHVVHRDASGELWMTFTRDPDDQVIGLMQQRESASAVM